MSKIAIILPCLNEAPTLEKVIVSFKQYLPNAVIYLIDNGSTDESLEIAQKQDNINILIEENKGKANAVKKAFKEIDADIYIMVDTDNTYELKNVAQYVDYFEKNHLDYLNIVRKYSSEYKYNILRRFGNKIFDYVVNSLFKTKSNDILSGFKIFSNNFVKPFDIKTNGFELETEMFLYSKKNKFNSDEMSCDYYPRVYNSHSKLSFLIDGIEILKFVFLYEK